MNKNTITAIIPDFMEKFDCINSRCPDNCCASSWFISVDKVTFKKYKSSKYQLESFSLSNGVKKNKEFTDRNYGHIIMENSQCNFLDERRLCKIHAELGEEFLSQVCAVYPRSSKVIDGILEETATISCPVITKLALMNKEGIKFIESKTYRNRRSFIRETIDTSILDKKNHMYWFKEFREYSILLIQDRKHTLMNRMILLGLFMNRTSNYIINNNQGEFLGLIEAFEKDRLSENLGALIDTIKPNQDIQLTILKKIADLRFHYPILNDKFISYYKEFLAGIGFFENVSEKDLLINFNEALNKYNSELEYEIEYMLENYLVNYIFQNTFPFKNNSNCFDEYCMLSINYCIISFFIIGINNERNIVTESDFLDFMQVYAKTIEHNPQYLMDVYDFLTANKMNNLAHIAVLIKR